jgi:glycosyltransferase involved in cell wall biosynthesis
MRKSKVALLVNQVAPNRVRLYEHLASYFDLVILHGETEANRSSWKECKVTAARMRRVAGWQLPLAKRDRGKRIDTWFLHIEPGYLFDLFRERPDAVITFEMGVRTCAALIYGALFRKPVWIWWGGTLHTERNVGKLRRTSRHLIAKWTKRWISYGHAATEYLRMLGIPREQITQIQNGVDESWYTRPAKPVLNLDPKPVLLHVGQMIARKGVAEFLRAAARLQQEGRGFSIVFVGGGPDADRTKQLATELKLQNVWFYPAQPPNALPSFYHSADILVFPTLEDVWGLVVNEALLSGVPVLCSKYAGCARELCDSESIFDPLDERDFLEAMRRAVSGALPQPVPSRIKDTPTVAKIIIDAVSSVSAPSSSTGSVREDLSQDTAIT